MNTEAEFKEKYDLEYSDLEYISNMISMGSSLLDIANSMGIELGDLEDMWGDESELFTISEQTVS